MHINQLILNPSIINIVKEIMRRKTDKMHSNSTVLIVSLSNSLLFGLSVFLLEDMLQSILIIAKNIEMNIDIANYVFVNDSNSGSSRRQHQWNKEKDNNLKNVAIKYCEMLLDNIPYIEIIVVLSSKAE